MIARLVLLAASLLIGGCVETRFESTPGSVIESCDERWKGLWLDVSEKAPIDGADVAFLVDESCRLQWLERPEKNGPVKAVHIPINFVRDGAHDYVVVADNQISAVVDLPKVHGVDPQPAKSFLIARYRLRDDRLEIDAIDSRRVARLVVDNVLDGSVDSRRNELHVYVRGDRARILEILRTQPVFSDQPSARLERSTLTLEQYEREYLHAGKRK
ncbi:MAG: hypothetical protein ABI650_01200 [Dokdonella sp.]